MSNSFLPAEDGALNTWLQNFKTVALANQNVLELTPGEIQEVTDNPVAFNSALNNVESKKLAYRGAVAGKDASKSLNGSMARRLARKFKSNPEVSESLLMQLGVVASNSRGPVVPVLNLVVTGCSDGVNKLRWNKSTNSAGTVYIIESSMNGTDWEFVAVVSKTNFSHEFQPVGELQWYRVTANRAGQSSVPCPPVSVYGAGGNGEFSAAA